MNEMLPAVPQRAPDRSAPAADDARGCLTGVSLADVRPLRLPHALDAFGYLRPPLHHAALEMSLELAYMTYTLDLDPWMHAGWKDISIQVDNRLQSGVTVGLSENAASEHMRALINGWKVARARMALKEYNPVTQIMSAFRQRNGSDTIKAVTMIHPAEEGRYTVAIGFMGTGSRFYDWFSNFRFTTEEGFHKGFRQLTLTFEQSARRILFPAAAQELGLATLTLADVLDEMRTPDSRFSLWMAGHSQGGAVMQVFCHRLVTDWGVLPRHMVGYGFASPTTLTGDVGRPPAAYPLYHLMNSDDLVPRIGALKHLGLCLYYRADDALRSNAYGWADTPGDAAARATAEKLMEHVADTPTMLEALAALCDTVVEEKTEEALNSLLEKWWSIAPLDKAFTFARGKTTASLNRIARYARVAYRSGSGKRMDEETVHLLQEQMRPILREETVRWLLVALRDRFYPPHMMCRPHRAKGAYGYIAKEGSARLRPSVWADAPGKPHRLYAEGYAAFVPFTGAVGNLPRRRSAPYRAPAGFSPRGRGIGALRARHSAAAERRLPISRPPHRRVEMRSSVRIPWKNRLLTGRLWKRKT